MGQLKQGLLNFLVLLSLFKSSVSQCGEGEWVENNGYCYMIKSLESDKLSWHDAESICNSFGGYLGSITSQAEQDVFLQIAENRSHAGNIWIGFNKLSDRNGNFVWSDGSASNYTNWAGGQPNIDNAEYCAHAEILSDAPSDCLTGIGGRNTVVGIINSPEEANPPDTFHFGEWAEDLEGEDLCKEECRKVPECHSYTFVYTGATNVYPSLAGHCIGRSDKYDLDEQDFWCYAGSRVPCMNTYNVSGLWYTSNCGVPQGYMCKKHVDAGTPVTTIAPPPVDSYCPQGYFNIINGNKCFKVVTTKHDNTDNGKTWDEALQLCRAGPGLRPDIASISNDIENAEVLGALQDYVYGVWLGYYVDVKSELWVWADNSNTAFVNWDSDSDKPDEGNKTCTEMWVSPGKPGTWSNLNCQEKRGYVCQTYKDPDNPIDSPPNTTPFTCPTGFTPYWYACYKLHTVAKTWQEAEDLCISESSHLVSIHTEMENSAVYAFTHNHGSTWIGFKQGEDDVYRWTDNWINRYTNWEEGGTEGGEGCVEMTNTGQWRDVDCSKVQNFTCKYSENPIWTTPALTEGYCPTDWYEYGGHCYYFGSEELTWIQAEYKCAEIAGSTFNGHLTSIHSHTEDHLIQEHLLKQVSMAAWIGLNRTGSENGFAWSDGSALDFEFWAPEQPSNGDVENQCVEISTIHWAGAWLDVSCNDTRTSYVCITPKNAITTPTTPTTAPTTTPTTPTTTTPTTTPQLPPTGAQQCPSEEWEKYEDMCFLFKTDVPVTWEAAVDACVSASEGKASLASIHSSTENWFLHDIIKDQSTNYWLGLSKEGPEECFDRVDGKSSVKGVINSPGDVSPPDTFHFGKWGTSDNDEEGIAWCQGECAKIPECFSYTFSSVSNTDIQWARHCHGISDALDVDVTDLFSYRGSRVPCRTKILEDEPYVWVDGTSLDYENWDESSDQGSLCVEISSDTGKWNDMSCGSNLGYICRWTDDGDHTIIPTVPSTTTTTTSTTTTTVTITTATTTSIVSNTTTVGQPPPSTTPSAGCCNAGQAVGILIAVVAVVGVCGALVVFFLRKNKEKGANATETDMHYDNIPNDYFDNPLSNKSEHNRNPPVEMKDKTYGTADYDNVKNGVLYLNSDA